MPRKQQLERQQDRHWLPHRGKTFPPSLHPQRCATLGRAGLMSSDRYKSLCCKPPGEFRLKPSGSGSLGPKGFGSCLKTARRAIYLAAASPSNIHWLRPSLSNRQRAADRPPVEFSTNRQRAAPPAQAHASICKPAIVLHSLTGLELAPFSHPVFAAGGLARRGIALPYPLSLSRTQACRITTNWF